MQRNQSMGECVHDMPSAWCSICADGSSSPTDEPSLTPQPPSSATQIDGWPDYDRWNAAIAEAVYTDESNQQPAYLDIEDEVLAQIAARDGMERRPEHAAAVLCTTVRRTIALEPGKHDGGAFAEHRRRVETWKARSRTGMHPSDPPPVIALLAVFSLAAERMKTDETFHANAYYPRLIQLLDVPVRAQSRLKVGFQRDSEYLWGVLSDWLVGLEGRIGLPTAETVAYRYVGIPMSQALIRNADRQRFVQLFQDARLDPGMALSTRDIAPCLQRWVSGGRAPTAIRKLWRSPNGRRFVAEAAVNALSQWDGSVAGIEGRERGLPAPALTARIINGFRGRSIRLSFAVRASATNETAQDPLWTVESAADKPEVRLVPINDRYLAPDLPVGVDPSTLLMGNLAVRSPAVDGRQPIATRRPQPLIVLRHLSEAGMYIEVERVKLLERHLLLVNLGSRRIASGDLDFDHALVKVAEPGATRDESITGLPAGWALYRDVIIARTPLDPDPFLEPMVPAQGSALVVAGGLRLPGHAVRWHTDAPLRITAAASGASSLSLAISRVDDDETIDSWTGDVEEISVSTENLHLGPGQYHAVASYRVGRDRHESVANFALCNSEDPRLRSVGSGLAYDLSDPLGALSADHRVSAGVGQPLSVVAELETREPDDGTELERVWWSLTSIDYEPEVFATSVNASCAMTGAHRWDIETHQKWMKKDRGECRTCGRIVFFPPGGRKKGTGEAAAQPVRRLRRLMLGKQRTRISGETLLDAIIWLGGGTPHELASVIRQVYDSALSVDEITRLLETVGHINVSRERRSFAATEWEVSPRSLCGLSDGSWIAVGAWSRIDIDAARDVAAEYGGRLETEAVDWLPRHAVTGIDARSAALVAEAMDATCVPDAGRRLLAQLPNLPAAGASLSSVSAEGVFRAERFDPAQGSWLPVSTVRNPGAYRLKNGFVSSYYVRTATDVDAGRMRRADARVVKHLAAIERPIIGYDAAARRLLVPLGADLPGLYGRAVSLLSGRPPAKVDGQPLLAYGDVEPTAAQTLVQKMRG